MSEDEKDFLEINLHCHSNVSDGSLTPEELAALVGSSGALYAALTDHDTCSGETRFKEILSQKGKVSIPGTELTVMSGRREIHLLVYGLDLKDGRFENILHRKGAKFEPSSFGDAVRIVHHAGGLAFLAHPLAVSDKLDVLEKIIEELKAEGLDGIESVYAPYTQAEQNALTSLADKYGLLICGGTDYHWPDGKPSSDLSVRMPVGRWKQFRDALLEAGKKNEPPAEEDEGPAGKKPNDFSRNRFAVRIVLPTALAVGLFIISLFIIIIPRFEKVLLDRKKEMIHELTISAISILTEYYTDEQAGHYSEEQAKAAAAARIRDIRYGREGKDYFWITDMHPMMIVHPYRKDLEGSDVSGFRDSKGDLVFMEFVNAVRNKDEGYVEYVWQWKDDSGRVVPKLSFVRKFAPWDWVIGTGIYLEDVYSEISHIAGQFIWISAVISVTVFLLLLFAAQQSYRIERRRSSAEEALRWSHERYRALAEASTEGMFLMMNGICSYANRVFFNMTGYTGTELQLLGFNDIIEPWESEGSIDDRKLVQASVPVAGGLPSHSQEYILKRKDEKKIHVFLSISPFESGSTSGFVCTVRDVTLLRTAERSGNIPRKHVEIVTERDLDSLLLSGRAGTLSKKACTADLALPIQAAADRMTHENSSSLIILGKENIPIGIVTDGDLRTRFISGGEGPGAPVASIMTSPLVSIDGTAPLYQVLQIMREKSITVLPVRDRNGRITGVLDERDLAAVQQYSLPILYREAEDAGSIPRILEVKSKLVKMINTWYRLGLKPSVISRLSVPVSDKITECCAAAAVNDIGTPPCAFSFIVLGSEARREQLPGSDQDNALIFSCSTEEEESVRPYFLLLGERICSMLNTAGIRYCSGNIMAENPRWCVSLREWKTYFRKWIREPAPEELLDFNIFFDFRCLYGDFSLPEILASYIQRLLADAPEFFIYYAKDLIDKRIPGSGRGTVNIKEITALLVSYARLSALHHGIPELNTHERFRELAVKGFLSWDDFRDLSQVYDFTMSLRLKNQLESYGMENGDTGDTVSLKELGQSEAVLLKEAVRQSALAQRMTALKFLGSAL